MGQHDGVSYVVEAHIYSYYDKTGYTVELEGGGKIAGFPTVQEAKEYVRDLASDGQPGAEP